MKILLVEDNLLNQKVITFHLRKKQYEVIAVIKGSDALFEFYKTKFDLILMDIMLPEKNGYEITSEIRKYEKKHKKIPVTIIAVTANTLDNDKDKCINAGMDEYLAKPFTSQDLYNMINKFI